jgi:hypothetical protein
MAALALALSLPALPAAAHSTGHEARTAADCRKLDGPQEGLRESCEKCVANPKPHHFHPDLPPGQRCRPDEPKP